MYEKEINKLADMLTAANIPFELTPAWDGFQIVYPANGDARVCDAVCHSGSYGHQDNLLEIMGLVDVEEVGDEVEGWLTAEDVFKRIQEHHSKSNLQTYTYDKNCDYYTEQCNKCVDAIIRNTPGVTVTAEEGGLVQVEATAEAAEIIEFLSDADCVAAFRATIPEVKKRYE